MDVWNYILGYKNTLKSVFETWFVHIPFNCVVGVACAQAFANTNFTRGPVPTKLTF